MSRGGAYIWLNNEQELAFQRWMNEQGTVPEDSTGTAGAVLGAAAPAPAPAPRPRYGPAAARDVRLNDPAWQDFSRVPPPAEGQGAGRGAPGKGKGKGKPSQPGKGKGGGKGKDYGKGAYGGRYGRPYSGPYANV